MDPVALLTVDHSPAAAAEATSSLLARAAPPTALVYGSDTLAIGGINREKSLGLTIPDDLSIVGCGRTPIAEWLQPPLTTVDRRSFTRRHTAAARLLALLGEPVDRVDPVDPRRLSSSRTRTHHPLFYRSERQAS